jgi:hypothetical protein
LFPSWQRKLAHAASLLITQHTHSEFDKVW